MAEVFHFQACSNYFPIFVFSPSHERWVQVVDTVELFHFKRQRKLSLRFLAGYLLGAAIQKDTHDSIVDARTALSLFEVCTPPNNESFLQFDRAEREARGLPRVCAAVGTCSRSMGSGHAGVFLPRCEQSGGLVKARKG